MHEISLTDYYAMSLTREKYICHMENKGYICASKEFYSNTAHSLTGISDLLKNTSLKQTSLHTSERARLRTVMYLPAHCQCATTKQEKLLPKYL